MDQEPPQPTISPTPPAPKPSILLAVLSIFLCISLAGIGLLAYQNMQLQKQIISLQSQPTPTPLPAETLVKEGDPTANWKTYTNSKYNFTFKYPDNKRVVFDTIGYGVLSKPMIVSISLYSNGFQMPKFNTGFKGELTFSITVVPTPDNDIVNWVKDEGRLTWIYDARVEKSVMDNLPGYTLVEQKKGLNKLVVTNHNNNLFLINAYGESKHAINDVFGQILSTFTFLDNTSEGILEATVMRSPTCGGPVSVTDETTCEAPLANKTLRITRSADSVVFQTVNTDKDGKFTVSLPVGNYQLQRYPDEFGGNIENPNFTIISGQTTSQRFSIDTGIR